MIDFISAIRTDRAREIKEREKQEIKIYNKKDYRIVDKITVPINSNIYIFGVQADALDIYFYITDNSANSYYDIEELYHILKNCCDCGHSSVVIDTLKKMLETSSTNDERSDINRQVFIYRDVDYYINMPSLPSYDGMIPMQDGGGGISYNQLFLLISLLQEKSNAFFEKGSSNFEYRNGLVRLFIALILLEEDVDELEKRGWKYDYSDNIFTFQKNNDGYPDNKYKYCLTESEYNSIISL